MVVIPLDRDAICSEMQAAACANRTQRDHYASSAEWGFGFDSSSYGPIVGCVTNILVVALLPDKEWPTVVCRDLHVCSAAVFRMVSMWKGCAQSKLLADWCEWR